MGEAKRRGTFEQRREQAIEADRQASEQRVAVQQQIPIRRGKSSAMTLIVGALAASLQTVKL